jgi:hypothetical protein
MTIRKSWGCLVNFCGSYGYVAPLAGADLSLRLRGCFREASVEVIETSGFVGKRLVGDGGPRSLRMRSRNANRTTPGRCVILAWSVK